MTHELKILPIYFEEVLTRQKRFELRKDDRGYEPGDRLYLREWENGTYTGRELHTKIRYILRNAKEYGLQEGFCILGLDDTMIEAWRAS